jgi:hypothetical protein
MIQLTELVGGIPKRRRRPDYGSLAFVLGYTTAQLRNAYQQLMQESVRQAQELGSAVGSLLAMLLAQQAMASQAPQSVAGAMTAPEAMAPSAPTNSIILPQGPGPSAAPQSFSQVLSTPQG